MRVQDEERTTVYRVLSVDQNESTINKFRVK